MDNIQKLIFLINDPSDKILDEPLNTIINDCFYNDASKQIFDYTLNGFTSFDLDETKCLDSNSYKLNDIVFIPFNKLKDNTTKYIPFIVDCKSYGKIFFRSYFTYYQLLDLSPRIQYDFRKKVSEQLQNKIINVFRAQRSFHAPSFLKFSIKTDK